MLLDFAFGSPCLGDRLERDLSLINKTMPDRSAIALIPDVASSSGAFEPTVLTGTAELHRRFAITPAQFDDFAQSFLDTLRSVGESEQAVHAWKLSIRPGLEYLKRQASVAPKPFSSREHPPAGTAHPGLSNSRTGKRPAGGQARRRRERVPVASR